MLEKYEQELNLLNREHNKIKKSLNELMSKKKLLRSKIKEARGQTKEQTVREGICEHCNAYRYKFFNKHNRKNHCLFCRRFTKTTPSCQGLSMTVHLYYILYGTRESIFSPHDRRRRDNPDFPKWKEFMERTYSEKLDRIKSKYKNKTLHFPTLRHPMEIQ